MSGYFKLSERFQLAYVPECDLSDGALVPATPGLPLNGLGHLRHALDDLPDVLDGANVKHAGSLRLHGCPPKPDLPLCLLNPLQVVLMLGREVGDECGVMFEGAFSGGAQDLEKVLVLRLKVLVDTHLLLLDLSDHLATRQLECSNFFDSLFSAFLKHPEVIFKHFYMMLFVVSDCALNANAASASQAIGFTLETRVNRTHWIESAIGMSSRHYLLYGSSFIDLFEILSYLLMNQALQGDTQLHH